MGPFHRAAAGEGEGEGGGALSSLLACLHHRPAFAAASQPYPPDLPYPLAPYRPWFNQTRSPPHCHQHTKLPLPLNLSPMPSPTHRPAHPPNHEPTLDPRR